MKNLVFDKRDMLRLLDSWVGKVADYWVPQLRAARDDYFSVPVKTGFVSSHWRYLAPRLKSVEFQLDRRLQGLHGVMLKHRIVSVAFTSQFFKIIAGIKLWFILQHPSEQPLEQGVQQ
jgi:hypothetical protein